MSEQKIAESMADLAIATTYQVLPEEVVEYVKTLVLDVLGSMIGTRDIVSSRIAADLALEFGGPCESTILGRKQKVAAVNAAFANAIQAYGFDFIDDHNESNAHPSAATIPVSLVLGEASQHSGKELIEAIALGNELVCRLGSGYLGQMYYQGFHPTSTCGTMGAAVSAAKLLKLNRKQIIYSQGIAGSMVAGLMAWNSVGSYTKRLQAGHPAMCGIIAAKMAQKGFNGPNDIYEGVDGILHAYSHKDQYDAELVTRELGETWMFRTSSIKVYPCCRYSGGHLDACLEIVEKYKPDPRQIKKIFIRSSKYTIRLLAEPRKWDPQNVVDSQFSMPYQAAIAFVRGKVGVEEFTEGSLRDPLVGQLMKIVGVIVDEEFERRYPDQYSSAVTVTMKDGNEYTAVVDNPKGDKRNPVSHQDVENKFRSLASPVIGNDVRVQKIIDTINDLESIENIAELIRLANSPVGG